MKQFTLREFQTDPNTCLRSGSFKLTRYGKVIGTFIPERITQHYKGEVGELHNISIEKESIAPQITQHPQEIGHCQAPYCKHSGEVFDGLYKEWFNGELKTKPMKLCQTHLDKYEAMIE